MTLSNHIPFLLATWHNAVRTRVGVHTQVAFGTSWKCKGCVALLLQIFIAFTKKHKLWLDGNELEPIAPSISQPTLTGVGYQRTIPTNKGHF